MAESDFTVFTNATNGALDPGDVSKGVSNGFTPPDGGPSFVYGLHSLNAVTGFAGAYYNANNFNPISTGKAGSLRVAMRRYAAGTGYAPIAGFLAGTNVASNYGYFLALSNTDPYQIVLVKGIPANGAPASGATVLRASSESFASNTQWLHLRLDIIVQPHGDVTLAVFRNDIDEAAQDVTEANQVWEAIPGMDDYVDDALGILSGSVPLVSGFRGFLGMYVGGEAGKVALFDHLEVHRALAP